MEAASPACGVRLKTIVLDAGAPSFATSTCVLLRQQGFALLRLTPADATLVREHLKAATAFFNDDQATRGTHIPPRERSSHDSRNGYVSEPGREFLEVHPRAGHRPLTPSSPATAAVLTTSARVSAMCHDLCCRVLDALSSESELLAALTRAEEAAATADGDADGQETYSASMLRTICYPGPNSGYGAHTDLGLLTLAPRGSSAGLEVQLPSGEWVAIEESMGADEALLLRL